MSDIDAQLAGQVRMFLEGGDRGFLTTLLAMDRTDITGQAVVRYLFQLKHWPQTPDGEFTEVLNHLFAEYPGRPTRDPATYRDETAGMIMTTFGHECVTIVPEAKPAAEKTTTRKAPARKTTRRIIKSSEPEGDATTDLDTTGASGRLKKVIAIQRGATCEE